MYKIFSKTIKNYEDEPFKWFQDLIQSSSIYLSNPQSFNDPYDCAVNLDFESASDEDLRQFFSSALQPPPSIPEMNDFIERFKNDPEFREERLALFKATIAKNYQGKIGVFCLTSNVSNFPMWAHYGENHTGIAIGFDAEKLIKDTNCRIDPVQYVEKFASLGVVNNYTKNIDTLALLKLYFCQKSKDWEYESEKRIVITNLSDDQRKFRIEPGTIHSIYFGAKMSDSDIDSLKEMILKSSFKNAKLFKMKISPSAFKLIRESL